MDRGIYENNVAISCFFELTNEIKSFGFLAKKYNLFGIQSTGSTHGEWGNLAKTFLNETLVDLEVNILLKVI